MHPVGIRGVGLSCALGLDADTCVTRLLAAERLPDAIQLDGLAEPVDLKYFRIPDGEPLFDPSRFEALIPHVVEAALTGSGLSPAERRKMPVFLGSSCFTIGYAESRYATALSAADADAFPMPHCGYGELAEPARRTAGAEGPVYVYNTACTSSANALLGAVRALALGRHAHALVLGAELANRTTLAGFSGMQLLTDRLRPFAAERSGMVLGEGVGAVLLSAQPRDDEYRLHGGANNCDSHSVTTADPGGASVAAVLRRAMYSTGTHEVRGIRAHGTASGSGDMAEASGLRQVFDAVPPLSALKAYVGHTLGACGVNELILYMGALQRGNLPMLRDAGTPDPELGVRALDRPLLALPGRYLMNHLGFGGNNTVLVLEKP